jgi:spore coat polysaccharide biosynthesis predicted glycosyltransferase SpsG/CMP-N-acetylneuraminic acid synthetase
MVAGQAIVHERTGALADDATTLDEVALDVARWLLAEQGAIETDLLLTVQPTSPFISAASIRRAFEQIRECGGSVVSVRDDRHLRWTLEDGRAKPLFSARLNRQWLPPSFTETGGLIGTSLGQLAEKKTRIVDPVTLLELDSREGLDIDTHSDWAIAEFFAGRKKIVIRADGAPTLGMGHAYRALALAQEVAAHDLRVVTRGDGEHALGADLLSERLRPDALIKIDDEEQFFEFLENFEADILIADVLDTSADYVKRLKDHARFVVTIEDLGEGSRFADVVINDLYTDPYPNENHWFGVQHALLGPQFETIGPAEAPSEEVRRILVTFGGSDPSDLTRLALSALSEMRFAGHVDVVLGPGYGHGDVSLADHGLEGEVVRGTTNLALLMHAADLAITSAGRTVTELMTQGIPTISLCQNARELMHTHASSPFGVANLGLGDHLTADMLARHIAMIAADLPLRTSMHERMLKSVRGRSNHAIVDRIMRAAEGADFETEGA